MNTYEKTRAILETQELLKAHKMCLGLNFDDLSKEDEQMVDDIYNLGVDRGFIKKPEENFTEQQTTEEPEEVMTDRDYIKNIADITDEMCDDGSDYCDSRLGWGGNYYETDDVDDYKNIEQMAHTMFPRNEEDYVYEEDSDSDFEDDLNSVDESENATQYDIKNAWVKAKADVENCNDVQDCKNLLISKKEAIEDAISKIPDTKIANDLRQAYVSVSGKGQLNENLLKATTVNAIKLLTCLLLTVVYLTFEGVGLGGKVITFIGNLITKISNKANKSIKKFARNRLLEFDASLMEASDDEDSNDEQEEDSDSDFEDAVEHDDDSSEGTEEDDESMSDDNDSDDSEESDDSSEEDSEEDSEDDPNSDIDDTETDQDGDGIDDESGLDVQEKAQLKDEYKTLAKEILDKMELGKPLVDASVSDIAKFWAKMAAKWEKNDPHEFMSPTEQNEILKITIDDEDGDDESVEAEIEDYESDKDSDEGDSDSDDSDDEIEVEVDDEDVESEDETEEKDDDSSKSDDEDEEEGDDEED